MSKVLVSSCIGREDIAKAIKDLNPSSIFDKSVNKKKQRKLKKKLREQARRQKRLDKLAQK